MLEFALMAATHVMDDPERYEETKITGLSWFIVDALQELRASATQLEIVQRKTGAGTPTFRNMSEKEISGNSNWLKRDLKSRLTILSKNK